MSWIEAIAMVDLPGILFISLYIQLQSPTNYFKNTSQHEPPATSARETHSSSSSCPLLAFIPFLCSVSALTFFLSQMLDCSPSESNSLLVSSRIRFDLTDRAGMENKHPQSSDLVS
ncbi:unnamed protein product [Pleuronectes platessa]|uniref:Uncharacterized protein n=1 Tax=Pleuronectes platessa TaxID=8262 RepID=A0A9N7UMR2_PLEPL|nr:unnamed protein product [Pleuronectes platessa]